MANTASAKKAWRQTIRRTRVARGRKGQVRAAVKRAVTSMVLAKDEPWTSLKEKESETKIIAAESALMCAAHKGIFHKKTASRKVSRMVKRLRLLSGSLSKSGTTH